MVFWFLVENGKDCDQKTGKEKENAEQQKPFLFHLTCSRNVSIHFEKQKRDSYDQILR